MGLKEKVVLAPLPRSQADSEQDRPGQRGYPGCCGASPGFTESSASFPLPCWGVG